MPAILVHYTFALEAISEEDRPFERAVRLGSQGPDTFMAYGTIPWKKRAEAVKIRQWGHTMHSLPIETVYLKMVDYALKSPDKDLLFAYIDGLLMHYCADRILHAYIFSRSGFDKAGRLPGYWGWSHGFFEAILDKTFATRKGTYGKLWKCIETDQDQVRKISQMWAETSPAHLDSEAFLRSYQDFVSAEKLLWNPTGIKHFLFRLIGKYSTPNAQSHPRFIKKFLPLDVENASHQEWVDPCTGETKNLSVDEMFEMALRDYKEVHQLLLRAKEGGDIREEFIAFTKKLDHEGCPLGTVKKHYDLCWEKLGIKKYFPPKEEAKRP
ncbi:MAG: hypothetical protein K6E59_06220 [Bacilli bacterium]|nr:hypothetical protein [Bacilli bacterium]